MSEVQAIFIYIFEDIFTALAMSAPIPYIYTNWVNLHLPNVMSKIKIKANEKNQARRNVEICDVAVK